jgi:uncharacterized membrane protein
VSTPIAVVTALAAALVLGISAVADQRSTKRVKTRQPLSPLILADLARQPLWLIAIGANIVGFALQVVALDFGSIALVQPILVFDLVFAVLIGWSLDRSAGTPRPGAPVMFAGVGATAAGVAGFLAIGRPSGGQDQASLSIVPPLAIGLVVVLGGCLTVAARNRNLRPLALALACGVCYGVAAFAIKLVTTEFGGGAAQVFTSWPIYVFAVVGPAGFVLNQDAFQQGTYLAPVQAIITSTDPVVSVALGVLWLDVRLRSSPAAIVGEVVSFLVMIVGIVITARHSPQAKGRAEATPTPDPRAALPGQTRITAG